MSEHSVKTILVPFAILSIIMVFYFSFIPHSTHADSTAVQVWWPSNGAHLSGSQPLKAMVSGFDVSQYDMYWQVDGGQLNRMDNNYTDYQHKEVTVGVDGWNWHGNGPYTLNFVAKKDGNVVAQQSEQIYIDQPAQQNQTSQNTATTSTVIISGTPVEVPVQPTGSTTSPSIVSTPVPNTSGFYVDANSQAAASGITALASQPTAAWFGNWNNDIQGDVHALVSKAEGQGTMPVLVAYNIPQRDCGSYSAGGANSVAGYTQWIQAFAQGIGNSPATVILEPDALSQVSCLSSKDQSTRLRLIALAVRTLKANQNTKVYIDAGHAGWVDTTVMAGRLAAADVNTADGFSLNVSNFDTTSSETSYGAQISTVLNTFIGENKHFVVDTGRNGNGSNGEWCNPSGRSIGSKPATQTGTPLVDAFLWIKTPGESDGTCNGGPSAGIWWQQYALSLVQNVH